MRILAMLLVCSSAFAADITKSLESSFSNGGLFMPLSLTMVAGFLSALSPCVYPLIPVTLSVMGSRRYETARQGFLVACSYVAGMSLIYASLGILFASIGMLLGSVMQHPIVLMMMAIFFLLLALSSLEIFTLTLPSSFMQKLGRIGGAGIKGAFLMGLVAGLIAAPCTGPVLGFILTLIASDGEMIKGMLLMLAFSIGMGLPFLILGSFISVLSHVPKPGPWMLYLKYLFGTAILATAFYYLTLAWPLFHSWLIDASSHGEKTIWLVAALSMCILFLLHRRWWGRLCPAVVTSLALTSLVITPDEITTISENILTWHVITDQNRDATSFDRLLASAKTSGQPVLVYFYADWCVACKQLELLTFRDTTVQERLNNYILIRIDATRSSPTITTLQQRYSVTGLPTITVIDADGMIRMPRILGFVPPEQFLTD